MRRGAGLVLLGLAMLTLAPEGNSGCVGNTNTFDVSPDGKTLYLSLNADAGLEADESSSLYAFDVEAGRLRALCGRAAEMGFCAISPDGKTLAFLENVKGNLAVKTLSLEANAEKTILDAEGVAGSPRFVPGFPDRLLVLAGKAWNVLGEKGLEPVLPAEDVGTGVPPALAPRRAAFTVTRKLPPAPGAEEEAVEQDIVVVDFTEQGRREAARVTVNELDEKDHAPSCQPLLSGDGKRLAVIVRQEGSSSVREADLANGKLGAKLFRIGESDAVSFTPDGRGFAILRQSADSASLMEIAVRRDGNADEKRALVVPGGWTGGTDVVLRWVSDRRMRLWRVSNEGISSFEVNADGTNPEAKRLPRAKLAVQRRLADAAYALEHKDTVSPKSRPEPAKADGQPEPIGARVLRERAEAEWAAADAAAKPVVDAVNGQKPDASKLLEAAWAGASGWKKVPGFPEPMRMVLEIKSRELAEAQALLDRCSKDPAFADHDRKDLEKTVHDLEEEIADLRNSLPHPAP